jgi:beta-phosphoglucomutase-like phosphatase (HAD superfamily)
MDEPKLVIFDVAGTTVKGEGRVADAFLVALREDGIEATAEQLKGVRGSSKREAVLHLIPEGAGRGALDATARREVAEELARRRVEALLRDHVIAFPQQGHHSGVDRAHP